MNLTEFIQKFWEATFSDCCHLSRSYSLKLQAHPKIINYFNFRYLENEIIFYLISRYIPVSSDKGKPVKAFNQLFLSIENRVNRIRRNLGIYAKEI